MILLSTDNPSNAVYYLGSKLLELMMEHQNSKYTLGVTDYFNLMNHFQPVSMNRFLLVLDWLFMLGKISSDSKRGLRLCI
nr:MAG TPA: hypothetical protein [Caudoviricetes sp.]